MDSRHAAPPAKPRPTPRTVVKGDYIQTDTGNVISRRAKIEGLPHIFLGGRVVLQHDVCLRGDLVPPPSSGSATKDDIRNAIYIGKYTYLSPGVTLHPAFRVLHDGGSSFIPMKVGSNVFIGEGSYVAAASIGSNVHIGAGCVIGNACVIADRVKVLDGSVMVAGMAVCSRVVVGGKPARIIEDLPPGWGFKPGGLGEEEWVEGGDLAALVRGVTKVK